jgi:hypothetical protein
MSKGPVFKQGQRVTWKDASGERQRGHVLQHSPSGRDAQDNERPEQVAVMREGSSHISMIPPEALALMEP